MNIVATSKHFVPILHSRHRYIILFGSRSSGKSYSQAQKCFIKLQTERNCNIVGIRKTYNKIKDTLYAEVVSAIDNAGCSADYKIKVSPIEITNLRNGNKMIFRGLDDPQSLKGLKNINCMAADEANEITLDEFIGANLSLRSDKKDAYLQTIICFNPEAHSDLNWLETMFFPINRADYEKEDGSHTYIKSTMPDTLLMHSAVEHTNDFVSDDYMKTIKGMERYGIESDRYRVAVKGLWGGILADRVFTNVEYGSTFPPRDHCDKWAYGLDLGFTNDPTALIKFALYRGEIYFEVLTYKHRLSTDDIIESIRRAGINRTDPIWTDQSDPRMIQAIHRAGFNCLPADKGKGSIMSGINFMQGFRIHIINSPDMEKEHKHYVFKCDKDGTSLNIPIDNYNHAMDSCRYAVRMEMMKAAIIFGATIM
jgi:phage terminase large subunit